MRLKRRHSNNRSRLGIVASTQESRHGGEKSARSKGRKSRFVDGSLHKAATAFYWGLWPPHSIKPVFSQEANFRAIQGSHNGSAAAQLTGVLDLHGIALARTLGSHCTFTTLGARIAAGLHRLIGRTE